MHKCVQSAIIVQRKEELLWCRLQAYAKTSHRPARSFQQKNAQEASSVDVFRNTLVQNMVQHSFSNHVDHIRRQTHGPTHTHGIFLRSNWHVHVHARTHTYTPWAIMNAHACLIESSKTTISLSAILECTAQAGPFAYTLHTKTLSYSECAGHAWLKAHAHTRTYSLDRKHAHTHTQIHTRALISRSYTAQAGPSEYTHTHTYIHTCTQHFAFDAENTHRRLFLTFK